MFTEKTIQEVWNNAKEILNQNPSKVRMDICNAIIWRNEYGNRNSEYGWEIDHIIPVSKGGTADFPNLQALHWENNAAKGDGELRCKITSENSRNKKIPYWDILFG